MDKLTDNDLALAEGDDPFDLPDGGPPLAKLMQPGSPELQKDGVAGATVGGFVIPDPRSDESLVYQGVKGFLLHSVAFTFAVPEWGSTRGRPVAVHPELPADAKWQDADESPDGNAGYFRELNGHSVVPTIYSHGVLAMPRAGFPMTLPFAKTSYAAGREFARRAQKLRALIEGEAEDGAIKPVELRGPTVGLWRITSVQRTKPGRTWYVLATQLIGKVGQELSLDDWRLAMRLRDSFKKGGSWPLELLEPPERPAIEAQPEPEPAVAHLQSARPKPIIITSGRQAYEQPPRDQAPPIAEAPDGPEDVSDVVP